MLPLAILEYTSFLHIIKKICLPYLLYVSEHQMYLV